MFFRNGTSRYATPRVSRSAFWRQVHRLAWETSRAHFVWTYPVGTGAAALLVSVWLRGWNQTTGDFYSAAIAAAVAVATGLGSYGLNLVRSAAQIHSESLSLITLIEAKRDAALAERDSTRDDARRNAEAAAERDSALAELTALESANPGIDCKMSILQPFWDVDGLDGVIVAIGIERLVNRNNVDASLEIVLRAPIRLAGWTTINIGVGPETKPAPFLEPLAPLLTPPLHVPAKRNLGQSYMLFNFRLSQLAPFPFEDLWKGRTADDLGKAIMESEMYLEITDVANGNPPLQVDAPGTLTKRVMRQAAARKAK